MLKNIRSGFYWQSVFACAVLCLMMLEFIKIIAPLRGGDLFDTYGIALIFAFAGIYFLKKGFSGPWEIKVFIIYLIWVVLSRIINRDFYLFIDYSFITRVLLGFLFFAAGTVLDSKCRDIFLDVLSLLYILFFFFGCMAGLFVVFTNTYIHILPENVWITVIPSGALNSINLFSTMRLVSAPRVFLAWALLIYQFFRRKNILVRVIIVLAVALIHFTLPLFHSRTIQIALCCCYAMLAILAVINIFKDKKILVQTLLSITAAVLALAISFLSFDFCLQITTNIREQVQPRFENYYNGIENKPDADYFGIVLPQEEIKEESVDTALGSDTTASDPNTTETDIMKPEPISMTDKRSLSGNKTFSGRTEIWQAGIIFVKENPVAAITGRLSKHVMPSINEILQTRVNPTVKEYKNHMHNMFMQVLMLTGFPGLLLVLCWTVLMVKNMLRYFFSKKEGTNAAVKLLTVPLAGIFILNLAEVAIFSELLDITGLCFYIIAGVFIGHYYDTFAVKE